MIEQLVSVLNSPRFHDGLDTPSRSNIFVADSRDMGNMILLKLHFVGPGSGSGSGGGGGGLPMMVNVNSSLLAESLAHMTS